MASQKEVTVSVIVPVYNIANYLAECLDSLINQTYRKLEIIVVDDGSTDASSQIADDYGKKDSRIKVIHQKNSGLSAARNAGLEVITGEYVAFLDGDDWVESNWIATQLETIEHEDADVSICGYEAVYQNTRIRNKSVPAHSVLNDYEDKKKLALGLDEWAGSTYAHSAVWKLLIKKECLIDSVTGKPLLFIVDRSYSEDLLYSLQVYKNAGRVAFNSHGLYNYRQRTTSLASALRFCFKVMHEYMLIAQMGLMSDADLLREEVLWLDRISLVNPKTLAPWEKEVFQKVISTCRNNAEVLYKMNLSLPRKLFAWLYLSKWPSFTFKYRMMKIAFAPLELVFRGRTKKNRVKFP